MSEAPQNNRHLLTDEQLKKLSENLTQDQIDALTDQAAVQLHNYVQKQSMSPDATLPSVASSEASTKQKAADKANPYVDTSLQTSKGTYPVRPLPKNEGPTDIKSFLASIGEAATSGADRSGAERGAPSPEAPNPFFDTGLNNPKTVGEKVRATQDVLIGAHQGVSDFGFRQIDTKPVSDAAAAAGYQMLKGTAESVSQFILDPIGQIKDHPVEFGMNLVQLALEANAFKGLRIPKIEPDVEVIPPFLEKRSFPEQRAMIADTVDRLHADGVPYNDAYDHFSLMKEKGKITGAQESGAFRELNRKYFPKEPESFGDLGAMPEAQGGGPGGDQPSELDKLLSESRGSRPPIPRHGEEALPVPSRAEIAKDAIKAASPEEALAANQHLDTTLDDISHLKDMNRQFGGNPEISAQLRASEKAIEDAQDALVSARQEAAAEAPKFEAGDRVTPNGAGETMAEQGRPERSYIVDKVEGNIAHVHDDLGRPSRFHVESLDHSQATFEQMQQLGNALSEDLNKPVGYTKPTVEEIAGIKKGGVPGREQVPSVTTSDGITWKKVGEVETKNGPVRYWEADRSIPGKMGKRFSDAEIQKFGLEHPDVAVANDAAQQVADRIKAETGDVPGEPTPEAPEKPPSEISTNTTQAQGAVKMTDILSITPMGGIILTGLAQDKKQDPTPSTGSPLALKSLLWAGAGGILAYGAFRYFKGIGTKSAYGAFRYSEAEAKSVSVEEFVKAYTASVGERLPNVASMEAGPGAVRGRQTADFEAFAQKVLAPMFPDIPANGLYPKIQGVGTVAGMVGGAYVGSGSGRDEFSVPGLLAGAFVGGAVGAVVGRSNLARMFDTDLTYKQLYQSLFTERGMMSESAYEAKKASRIRLEGRIRDIKDTVDEASRFDDETQGLMQAWMSGNANLSTVPQGARASALKMRHTFDNLTLDMLSSGLEMSDVLRETYTSNLGTYVPRLMLRYELDNGPTELVHSWLQSRGQSWGSLSPQNYNKWKSDMPADVLRAYGEITQNPGYLLAKRGVIVAADIENARYQRFILSSPENAIPEVTLARGIAAKKAYETLVAEDIAASKARTLSDKWDIGELPGPNYSADIARETRAKIEKKFATQEVPDTSHIPDKKSEEWKDAPAEQKDAWRKELGQAAKIVRQNERADQVITSADEYLAGDHPRFFTQKGGLSAAEWQGRTYWKMPENSKYGMLSGKYVERGAASDMMGLHDTPSGLSNLYTGSLSAFKYFKAVLNPASQFRNMFANVVFADLEAGIGFGPWNWHKWAGGFEDLASGSAKYQRAKKAGTFGGEFTKAEITSYLEPSMGKAENAMDYIGRAIPKVAEKSTVGVSDFFTKWHQSSEAWARQTVFNQATEVLGMTDREAAAFARRTIPDYQDVPRWIKVMRQSPFGSPFISFSYKAIPRTLEAATAFGNPKKMMAFWKYPMAIAALNEYGAQKFGLLGKNENKDVFGSFRRVMLSTLSANTHSPDSYDTYRKFLPNYVGNMQITIPWRDQYDRPQYLDATYFLPWGDAGEMGKGDLGQKLQIPGIGPFLPRQLEPSNPWFQTGMAVMTGKDAFTGKDIIPGGAVGNEWLANFGQFMMRAWGPSLAPGAGFGATSLQRSFSGDFGGSPNVKSPMGAVTSDLLGARSRPVDPRTAMRFRVIEFKDKLEKNMSEIRSLSRGTNWSNIDFEKPSDEDATKIEMLRQQHPNHPLVRAIKRRIAIVKDFKDTYLKEGPPPESPEKLVKAVQDFNKKKGEVKFTEAKPVPK